MNLPLSNTNNPLPGADYRYSFNGKEKDDEITGNSGDSYDFGARMYDSRLGRWTSLDPQRELYRSISPFAFAMNCPIKFIDKDGQLLVDPEGNYIYTTNGEPSADETAGRHYMSSVVNTEGNTVTTDRHVVPIMQSVTIYANDGTPIAASMQTGWQIMETTSITDQNGNQVGEPVITSMSYEQLDPAQKNDLEANPPGFDCHGLTFTGGKFWIENTAADEIILHDNYQEGNQNNSALVMYQGVAVDATGQTYDQGTIHSTPLNVDGSVNSKRGNGDLVQHSSVGREAKFYSEPSVLSGNEKTPSVEVNTQVTPIYYKYRANRTVNIGTTGSNGRNNADNNQKLEQFIKKEE